MRAKNRTSSNREIRHLRIRKKVQGYAERPRLSVFPSMNHFEAQIIDDFDQKTLVGFTTKAKDFQKSSGLTGWGNVKAATSFGKYVAERAKQKGIQKVVFDRGGRLYHGRIKAFADAARQGGLTF